jgi:leader peptidase (prepilin peptidase)/N-methyltransferase
LLFVISMSLLATSIVDIRTQRLPDLLTIVIGAACLGLAMFSGVEQLLIGMLSAAAVAGVAQGLRWFSAGFGEGASLGLGDVKLLAVLALWLGAATPVAVALAAACGLVAISVIRPKDGRLAFGPFIAASFFTVGVLQEMRPWSGVL